MVSFYYGIIEGELTVEAKIQLNTSGKRVRTVSRRIRNADRNQRSPLHSLTGL